MTATVQLHQTPGSYVGCSNFVDLLRFRAEHQGDDREGGQPQEPATLVLRPFNFNTLATQTFELAADERLNEASSSALAIVLVGILPVILLSRVIARSRPGFEA